MAQTSLNSRLRHVLSLSLTKTGDGLVDPKLVLSWALGSLGVSQFIIGLLVPLRESLAMLPQVFIAARLGPVSRRKFIWAAGSAVQALAVAGIAAALWFLGEAAGWPVAALVALFAIGRSLASVSYKDVLGKTVDEGERGATTGLAGSIAAGIILFWAATLSLGFLPLTLATIVIGIAVAAGFWLIAAGVFTTLDEPPSSEDAGAHSIAAVFATLKHDSQLRRFTLARALLASTALAPPFLMAASAGNAQNALGALGPLMLASALGEIVGSSLWGNTADRSSRKTMMSGGLMGAFILGALYVPSSFADVNTDGAIPTLWLAPAMFILVLAYQAVRLARSTHIVDMAPEDQRPAYAAATNTLVGFLLLFGGIFGWIAQTYGLPVVYLVMAATCLAGSLVAFTLDEAQGAG